eukprot:5573282-Pleurochrysis_carterae.AAC.8
MKKDSDTAADHGKGEAEQASYERRVVGIGYSAAEASRVPSGALGRCAQSGMGCEKKGAARCAQAERAS